MKKKIMLLMSTWQESFSREIISGIEKYVQDKDIEIHIFNAYGATIEFYTKETEIFYLAELKNYDGVIALLNTVDSDIYLEDFAKKCREYGIPMLSIDRKVDGIAYCGIDNYPSFYSMVEHLIKDHGYKKLYFIGGPQDHPETIIRYQAFVDCVKAYGLEPYGYGFFGYMRSSGRKAFEEIEQQEKLDADVFVCANDFSAIGFFAAAKEKGMMSPKDFRITGFDNTVNAVKNMPRLTSVDRNLGELGYQSIAHLMKLILKETDQMEVVVPGRVTRGATCGCKVEIDLDDYYREFNLRIQQRDELDDIQRKARELLCGNSSFEQYQEGLRKCNQVYNVEEIVIGVNHFLSDSQKKDFNSYDEVMNTYGMHFNEPLNRKERLIPKDWEESGEKLFFFASLHCKERTLGYSIFKYRPSILDFQFHRTLNDTAAMAVENIRQTLVLNEVNQRLEILYIRDSLTGLYNRFGYNSFAGECFKRNHGKVYIVFIDMDNLKKLNDGYGHEMGDVALKGIAEGIRSVYTDTDIHVRMGGDEFLVMGSYVEEEVLRKREIEMGKFLRKYSEENGLPLPLEVSMGYSFNEQPINDTGLESLLHFADARMYEKKQIKKAKK